MDFPGQSIQRIHRSHVRLIQREVALEPFKGRTKAAPKLDATNPSCGQCSVLVQMAMALLKPGSIERWCYAYLGPLLFLAQVLQMEQLDGVM